MGHSLLSDSLARTVGLALAVGLLALASCSSAPEVPAGPSQEQRDAYVAAVATGLGINYMSTVEDRASFDEGMLVLGEGVCADRATGRSQSDYQVQFRHELAATENGAGLPTTAMDAMSSLIWESATTQLCPPVQAARPGNPASLPPTWLILLGVLVGVPVALWALGLRRPVPMNPDRPQLAVAYQTGDVANGHTLGADNIWHPLPSAGAFGGLADYEPDGYWRRYGRRWKYSVLVILGLSLLGVSRPGYTLYDAAVTVVSAPLIFGSLVNLAVAAIPAHRGSRSPKGR